MRRLMAATLGQQWETPPVPGTWAGFELRHKVDVVEAFKLGEGRSPVSAVFWTRASVDCYRSRVPVNLVAFGENDRAAYCEAKRLGLDYVMVDSPEKMAGIRAEVEQNPRRAAASRCAAFCLPRLPVRRCRRCRIHVYQSGGGTS